MDVYFGYFSFQLNNFLRMTGLYFLFQVYKVFFLVSCGGEGKCLKQIHQSTLSVTLVTSPLIF